MPEPIVVRGNARHLPLPDCSIDAIVCDPPYELAFMARAWDSSGVAFDTEAWCEALRVLKPGGHLAAFGAPRTYHRVACAIEDAGFEIRDSIMSWLFGSGFPKGPNVLKPAHEPIIVARKPPGGTVTASVLRHGTGAINVDACRVTMSESDREVVDRRSGGEDQLRNGIYQDGAGGRPPGERFTSATGGRWPTNVVLAHHPDCGPDETPGPCVPDCQVAALDEQSGTLTSGTTKASHADHDGGRSGGIMGAHTSRQRTRDWSGDSGGASRFYPTFRYAAKAPAWQRPRLDDGSGFETVKPLDLLRWLVRLLTPRGGVVLDMFPGTGTTGQAAQLEGFRSVLVELEARHIEFIRARLDAPVRIDPNTDQAVPVARQPADAFSLFNLEEVR